jgi:hypothetical protein
MGVGGVLTTKGLITRRRQWKVADWEREKEWVKERGRGERERIYNENRGRVRRKM